MDTARVSMLAQELRELVQPVDGWECEDPKVLALQWESTIMDAVYDIESVQVGNAVWRLCEQVSDERSLNERSTVAEVIAAVLESADRLEVTYGLKSA